MNHGDCVINCDVTFTRRKCIHVLKISVEYHIYHALYCMDIRVVERYRGYLLFSVKDRNLFHRVDTISNIFTSGAATRENITDGVHEMK